MTSFAIKMERGQNVIFPHKTLHTLSQLTIPGPSVDGPPTKAIILAPEPGTQTPSKLAATLKAALVHLDAR